MKGHAEMCKNLIAEQARHTYYPIGKLYTDVRDNETDGTKKHVNRYILYDAIGEEFVTIANRKLRKALDDGYDIRGFCGSNIKTTSYYSKIRDIDAVVDGIANGEDIKPQWLVYRKDIKNLETTYRLVSEAGEHKVLTKAELMKFCEDNVVIGTRQTINKLGQSCWAIASSLIVQVNLSDIDISMDGDKSPTDDTKYIQKI